MIASTSRAARAGVEDRGGISAGQKRVLLYLHRAPEEAHTRAEIAQATGMKLQSVCARVRELLDDPFRRIEELAPRACRVTGNPSKPVRIAQSAAPISSSPPHHAAERPAARTPDPLSRAQGSGGATPPPSRALAIVQKNVERAQENRRLMPAVTAFVDDMRAAFPGCRVTYAAEAGRVLGAPGDPGIRLEPLRSRGRTKGKGGV